MSLLRVEGVSRSFGAVQAVDDVSIAVESGSVFGIIGPNGAGKTTLVNMISGHVKPDAGRIELDGQPIGGCRIHDVARAGIARTFQNIRLYQSLTALEIVAIGRHLHRRSDLLATLRRGRRRNNELGESLLERVGLDPAVHGRTVAGSLSYGDQRRLEIARGLAQEPKVLILDEPAAGMNAVEKEQLKPLLAQLVVDGLTLVLIEHDMRLVMGACDHIAVLNFGCRIAEGAPGEVSADPKVVEAYLGTRTESRPVRAPRPSSAAEPILRVEDLRVDYGAIQAVRGVSFGVREGEITALIGSNGAGKSTILRALSGLVPASGGKVAYRGQDLLCMGSPQIVRQGLVHVPEGREILARQTVRENLELGTWTRGDRKKVAREIDLMLEQFPTIGARADVSAGQLSGGEQQLLAILRALVANPKLLLLDEPSLGLAPQTAERVFELIEKLNGDGLSILLVEQNASRALELAHRAYVIETGEVALSGSGQELLDDQRVRQSYLGVGTEEAAPAPVPCA
jgi:ABC-type branched-subunit amino acid transport system ATPase component